MLGRPRCFLGNEGRSHGVEAFAVQVVPNCNSRAGLGETADGSLYEIFRREFGAPGTARFEAARHNFVVSEAGCAAGTTRHHGCSVPALIRCRAASLDLTHCISR